MKRLMCLIMCLLLCILPACTTKTGGSGVFGGLGDGKLDAVEAASLSLVVGGLLIC